MKKNLLILLILNCLSLNVLLAQQSNTYRDQVNNIFTNVNSEPITTGLLADYGVEFINIEKYNGVLADTNKVDPRGVPCALYIHILHEVQQQFHFAIPKAVEQYKIYTLKID